MTCDVRAWFQLKFGLEPGLSEFQKDWLSERRDKTQPQLASSQSQTINCAPTCVKHSPVLIWIFFFCSKLMSTMEECQHVKQSSMSTKRSNYYPLLYCLSPPQDVPDVLQNAAPPVAFRGRAADEKKRSNMEEVHVNMNSKFNELLMMMMMMMMMMLMTMMQSKSLTFLSTVKLFVLLVLLRSLSRRWCNRREALGFIWSSCWVVFATLPEKSMVQRRQPCLEHVSRL